MKKKFSRVLAIVLVIMTVVSMIPVTAGARTISGSSAFKSGKYGKALAAIALTGNQRTDIVNVAKTQVGYQEGGYAGTTRGSNNVTEYGRWYGMQDMWCAMFVSWCANQAGIPTSIVPSHSYTPTGLSWFKSRGRAYSRKTVANGGYTPQPGDIIYFKSSRNSNPTNHIGIVTSYSGKTVYTIEGNTSSATISTNGGAVAAKSYAITNTYVVYICKPAYTTGNAVSSGSGTTAPAKETVPAEFKEWVFDADYYADKNPDVEKAFGRDRTKLFNHFVECGIKEGRAGSALFDVKYYVNSSADLKSTFGTDYKRAFQHFIDCGHKEGSRKYSATLEALKPYIYDNQFYYEKYADLYKAFGKDYGKLFAHFMMNGIKEGRVANILFDITAYANDNADLKSAFNGKNFDAFKHFTRYYANELRATSPVIDARYYVKNNTDLASIKTTLAALDHFKSAGMKEGRRGSEKFDPKYYVDANKDLVNGGYTLANCYVHYVKHGISEGRPGTKAAATTASTIVDLGTNFYAKISIPATGLNLSLSGTTVIEYTPSSKPAQIWKFIRLSNGAYNIINTKTGQYLDAKDGKDTNGTPIQIYDNNGSTAQQWYVIKSGNAYALRPGCSKNAVLDVPGASKTAATALQLYTYNGTDAQLFNINKVDYIKSVAAENLGSSFKASIHYPHGGKNLSLSGTDVIIYPVSTAAAQKYTFTLQSDGSYELKNTKNGYCLDVNGAVNANGTKVQIATDNNTSAQRWYVHLYMGKYILRPACSTTRVLDVTGAATENMTKLELYDFNASNAQLFYIVKEGQSIPSGSTGSTSSGSTSTGTTSGSTGCDATPAQMAVLRKIMYAVETGGQVYGNADYDNFTEAYTNTANEHAITIGAGQWFATEAKRLLNTIRTKYPSVFAANDSAGIASDLDTKNWSTYKLSKTSAKAKCIQKIINTPEGRACQDMLLDEQMAKYMNEAKALGVTNIKAQMMCANIRHLGGLSAVKRVLNKTKGGYTVDNIMAAMSTDSGTQVGTFKSRHRVVVNCLNKYL